MNRKETTAELFDRLNKDPEYVTGLVQMMFSDQLNEALKRTGMNRADFARQLGTSQAYVTKILDATTNFTIQTMAKLATALDLVIDIELKTRGSVSTSYLPAEQGRFSTTPAVDHVAGPDDEGVLCA